jgi:ATP-dependent DNA ligase
MVYLGDLEGVVAKHKNGLYQGGMRSRTWLKSRTRSIAK